MASCSKSLTAASVALIVQDNDNYPQIQWTTPIHQLLPDDFVMSNAEATKNVTVEDMLCHRTGMARHDLSYMGVSAELPDDPRSVTRSLRDLPMATPEKRKYLLYSNIMYTVATHLIEVVTGTPFSTFLQEKIFDPLNMKSTYLQPSAALSAGKSSQMSSGHVYDEETNDWKIFEALESPEAQGAGSMITCTTDYIKWVQSMLNQTSPLSENICETLCHPRILEDEDRHEKDPFCSPFLYCLGWETYYYRGYQIMIHDGLVDGFASSHFFLPEQKFGAVLVGNSDGAEEATWILARQLIDVVLSIPEKDRPDWAAIQDAKTARDKSEYDPGKMAEELRQTLISDTGSIDMLSSEKYIGNYEHPGYHTLVVELKEEKLFIDVKDRGFPCCFTFEHVQTIKKEHDGETESKFIAHLVPIRGSIKEALEARFVFSEAGGVRMGIKMEEDLEGVDLIWFDKISS